MKWMIASDLHGSYYYAQQLQQAFEREQADRLLFLGDLLYHGPRNDLPRDYAPKKVIPLLNSLAPKLLCVRGNCDAYSRSDAEMDALISISMIHMIFMTSPHPDVTPIASHMLSIKKTDMLSHACLAKACASAWAASLWEAR